MSKEVMKLALEALQKIYIAPEHEEYIRVWWPACEQAITALREALAEQPAQQEPVDLQTRWPMKNWKENKATPQPAMQQEPWCMKMNGCKTKCEDCPVQVAQPEQEPVATLWQHGETGRTRITMPGDITDCDARWFKATDLYTSPPAQRKPPTDEQIDAEFDAFASKFDHESNEWLDMGVDAYFRAGFKAAHNIKENT